MHQPIRRSVQWGPIILATLGIVLPAAAAPTASKCPPDAVEVGPACVDKYEASVWETTDANLIKKIKDGTATLADLTAAGAVQRGAGALGGDDYGPGCPDSGNGCVDFYAASIPGVTPSRNLTWFQAVAAARNAGKRLTTNAEWQAAALGTPDPGATPGSEDCNTVSGISDPSLLDPDLTGARENCVSDAGVFDMVGNLFEWVAEWAPNAAPPCGTPMFEADENCVGGGPLGAGALLRGGHFANGTSAGVFNVLATSPVTSSHDIGFRAAR